MVVLFLVGIVDCAASARGGSVRCTTSLLSPAASPHPTSSAGATVRPWASGSEAGWLVDQPPVREGLQSWASQLLFDISAEVAVGELLVLSFFVRANNVTGSPAVAGSAVHKT
jgi:hypothetical protein